jgi:hypothetical protein
VELDIRADANDAVIGDEFRLATPGCRKGRPRRQQITRPGGGLPDDALDYERGLGSQSGRRKAQRQPEEMKQGSPHR